LESSQIYGFLANVGGGERGNEVIDGETHVGVSLPLRARLYKQSIPRLRSGFDPSDPIITHKHSPGISTFANHLIKVHAETSKTDTADKAWKINTAIAAVPEGLHQLRSSPA